MCEGGAVVVAEWCGGDESKLLLVTAEGKVVVLGVDGSVLAEAEDLDCNYTCGACCVLTCILGCVDGCVLLQRRGSAVTLV